MMSTKRWGFGHLFIVLLMLLMVATSGMLATRALLAAQAVYATAQRSAEVASEYYWVDLCGQRFVAILDQTLDVAHSYDLGAISLVESELPLIAYQVQDEAEGEAQGSELKSVRVNARMNDNVVSAIVQMPGEYRIDIKICIHDDCSYDILQWKASPEMDDDAVSEVLWQPEG